MNVMAVSCLLLVLTFCSVLNVAAVTLAMQAFPHCARPVVMLGRRILCCSPVLACWSATIDLQQFIWMIRKAQNTVLHQKK